MTGACRLPGGERRAEQSDPRPSPFERRRNRSTSERPEGRSSRTRSYPRPRRRVLAPSPGSASRPRDRPSGSRRRTESGNSLRSFRPAAARRSMCCSSGSFQGRAPPRTGYRGTAPAGSRTRSGPGRGQRSVRRRPTAAAPRRTGCSRSSSPLRGRTSAHRVHRTLLTSHCRSRETNVFGLSSRPIG